MATKGNFRVGCSGWQYKDWKGRFYPKELPQRKWLEYYTAAFDTVEVNNSFYRLPESATFAAWRDHTPDNFLFAVKASRYLTHLKKLKEPIEPIHRFWERAVELKEKLGPVLYQLPSRWPLNEERLFGFLEVAPEGPLQTIEFRDPSWYCDAVYRALERKGIALCLHDMAGSASPRRAVGPFVYLRMHGTGAKYHGAYSSKALRDWADWLAEQGQGGKDIYVYFNNDVEGHAVQDARRLREYLFAHL